MGRFQRGKQRLRQRPEGMAAVEFAIVLPVLLLIVCGIVDFGHLYYRVHIVNEAARVGARLAAVGGTYQEVQTAVQNFGSDLTVSMQPSPPISQQNVTVTVNSSVNFITPVISAFFPSNPYTVTGRCIMRVE